MKRPSRSKFLLCFRPVADGVDVAMLNPQDDQRVSMAIPSPSLSRKYPREPGESRRRRQSSSTESRSFSESHDGSISRHLSKQGRYEEPGDRNMTKQNETTTSSAEGGGSASWFNVDGALCLVAISLTVTVLWGRLLAILLTLIWLSLIPRRQDDGRRIVLCKEMVQPDTESNRRVIMEGLLRRDRQPDRWHCMASS